MASYEGEKDRLEDLRKRCLGMAKGIADTSELLVGIAEGDDYHGMIHQMLHFHVVTQVSLESNMMFLLQAEEQHRIDAEIAAHAQDGVDLIQMMLAKEDK